jgi:hypothetical protein
MECHDIGYITAIISEDVAKRGDKYSNILHIVGILKLNENLYGTDNSVQTYIVVNDHV